jgi:hypothetical protein
VGIEAAAHESVATALRVSWELERGEGDGRKVPWVSAAVLEGEAARAMYTR